MATRVLGPTGSRRRRRFLFVSLLLVAVAALFLAGAARAVHDETFQLDGNALAADVSHICGAGETPPCHAQSFDWDSFFNAAGAKSPVLPDASRPGYTASGFDRDFNTTANGAYDTSDATTYTQGSKDINNISSNWVCTSANNVTNKGDIQNAYAVAYTDPSTNDQFLYFAQERNSNAGDANVGFWFLQDNANCPNGGGAWTGNHVDGDLFIVSAFTNGGSVSTITAYRWVGGASGHIDPTPVAGGGDCRASTNTAADPICATANTSSISTPWLTNNNGKTNGLGHTLLTSEFFEGGINLTDSGLGNHCFNVFVGNTRSSQSLTATLYDFARGSLGECTSTNTTTPTPAAGSSTEIPANAQVTSSDSAHITVNGVSQFSGTVDFYICGPGVAAGANCQTGGSHVSQATLTDVTSPQDVSSDSVTLTEVGKYCWRAVYSGDTTRGVPGSTDPGNATSQTECFTLTPKTPNLTTCSGTYGGDPLTCTKDGTVDFGSSVRDNANLTGTANEPGTGGIGSDNSINPTGGNGAAQGTITFQLYGPDSCTTLARGFATAHPNGIVVNVNGDGVYDSASYTPLDPGVYHWKASYSGDSPNTNSTSTNANCTDTNEDVTVRQKPTSISTSQKVFPQDSALITDTISGDNLPAGGVVTFYLYGATAGGNTAAQNCLAHGTTVGSGGLLAIFTATQSTAAHTFPASTNNQTSVAVDSNATVYWRDTYAPNNTAYLGIQSNCVENTAVSFTNDSGPGTAFP